MRVPNVYRWPVGLRKMLRRHLHVAQVILDDVNERLDAPGDRTDAEIASLASAAYQASEMERRAASDLARFARLSIERCCQDPQSDDEEEDTSSTH